MPQKLFGTDGIRGVAGESPLTPEFITRIGAAIGDLLARASDSRRAILARDTRQSGAMIEHALAAGLLAAGFETLHAGILPTPGVAYLARACGAACGISISASHNPFQDNGIKVIGGDGFKIADALENEIEVRAQSENPARNKKFGAALSDPGVVRAYENFLLDAVQREPILRGKRVAVDCNNGATFQIAPRLLRALGAEVSTINVEPDGENINRGYDALEPRAVRDAVLRAGADFGVQFDGDGDRAVFVDERGNYLDGDFILAIFARDFAARGALTAHAVVSTVMANAGLEESLRALGVELKRTSVGDRWVTEAMRASGARLGGEQSGHIVLLDGGHTTGDGLYTTIRLAEILARRGEKLSALAACMQKFPQVLLNVNVPRKPPLENFPQIQSQVAESRAVLGDASRIVLRYSGTENLARVMIEGLDSVMIAREANAIARVIAENIL
ncbi:MAG: phosphoglucosamine mutase [Chloroflexi bacterium]|nr:phosphoglucosamine mutase [Chloroflexota bacterium]